MIFRLLALRRVANSVRSHPLPQCQSGVAEQHILFIQPDRTPRRRGQRPRTNKQALPGLGERFIAGVGKPGRQRIGYRKRPLRPPAAVS